MEKNSFFKTKAGILTIAFIVTVIAFILIMIGISSGSRALSSAGMIAVLAAMLFSPVKVLIIDRIKK